jgi:YfiH family protein
LSKTDWSLEMLDGLSLIFSPKLSELSSLKHAFTTRLGGQSTAPLDSFNLGRHIDDPKDREDAMNNREKLCQVLEVDYEKLVVPGQVHSDIVVWFEGQDNFKKVDGIATSNAEMPVLLHFADCVPIIIFSLKPAAVCVVHAGWRGTASAIARNGVLLLQKMIHARPSDMLAAVGPAIGSCCYPTSEQVAESLAQTVQHGKDLIVRKNNKPHPDLKAVNAMQLLESGVREVDVSSYCTACQPELFYSHRQSGSKTGRQGCIACIV